MTDTSKILSKIISNNIIEARTAKGLTQEELAQKMKTTQSSLARLESGKILPSIKILKRIADKLNTNLIPPRFAIQDEFKVSFYMPYHPTIKRYKSLDNALTEMITTGDSANSYTKINSLSTY